MRFIIIAVITLVYSIGYFSAYFMGFSAGKKLSDINKSCKYYPEQCPKIKRVKCIEEFEKAKAECGKAIEELLKPFINLCEKILRKFARFFK